MNETQQQIFLHGPDILLTEDHSCLYRLEEGSVSVFIVPLVHGHPGLRLHYCDIHAQDKKRTIPSLACQDEKGKRWRLLITSTSGAPAVLSILPQKATSVLHKGFLARCSILTYEEMGYEDSLIHYYTQEMQRQNAAIRNRGAQGSQPEDNTAYRAVKFLAPYLKGSVIPADELYSRCGKEPTASDIAAASGFLCRKVVLEENWHTRDCGHILGLMEDRIVACTVNRKGKYLMYDPLANETQPLTAALARQISPQAFSVGRTLPRKALSKWDVVEFCAGELRFRDLMPYCVLVALCALIGALLPTINQMVYDDYIPVGDLGNLLQICLVLLSFMTGNVAFSIVKSLFGYRITSRLGNNLQMAVYHRLFHLKESFFRKYDSADLAGRVSAIGSCAGAFANAFIVSGICCLFCVIYFFRMLSYSSKLTWLSVAMYFGFVLFSLWMTAFAHKSKKRIAKDQSLASGRLYQYLNGVDKLRMAGMEERALESFLEPYADSQFEQVRLNKLLSIEQALSTVIQSAFSMVIYWYIVRKMDMGSFSIGSYVAFNSTFGMFTATLDGFVDEVLMLMQEKAQIRRFWPVFAAVPEDEDDSVIPGTLSGEISLDHVSFRYDPNGKNILSDLSIRIRPGEYVGIVGPSGCGKSTLLKLLLGFESPQSGTVSIDRQDLKSLNKAAYRSQLGVVLQNGRLISGSIYDNITITAPGTPMARVNEVIRQVGLEEDINNMPMGIHTMLSESSGTISGGQLQRILIARAICGNPRILLFDEATSALDNITQSIVSRSLDRMRLTRVVVAHRLSTIMNCDRILVMDQGRIVEEGNYESLMAQKGLFYELASRQIAK
ncbi:MAG: NHLP bacteriocin export ABC transporter permease/ATPase subunit [Oscillospiraceae bacterium]|nr:NHLP bacteriocin export ABC transporter permease/ATPase subunit [Oscillospiraceae bacterium]